jgi:hypothetical protein
MPFNAADTVREDALADAHLGRGKACAVHVLHGFGHVGDKFGKLGSEFRHGLGDCAQHGIADDADIQDSHALFFLTVAAKGTNTV